ncbi:hypothetical protein ACFQH3_02875 [Haladaptatus sp. GCM10025707]
MVSLEPYPDDRWRSIGGDTAKLVVSGFPVGLIEGGQALVQFFATGAT